jgi:hypothetical protein
MSRQQMYDFGIANLGYVENPPKSNCNKFSKILGKPCQPWCGDGQTCCEVNGGFDPRKLCDNTSYTPNFYGDFAALGHATTLAKAELMDPVFFKFTDRINHVGGFIRMEGDYVITLDFNTGDGGANEYAGGTVAIKKRHRRLVAGVIHLPLSSESESLNILNDLHNAIQFSKAFTADNSGSTPQTQNHVLPTAVVQFLQVGLNRWMDKFAFMARIPNPDDIAITGVYDDPTKFCIGALRNILGLDRVSPGSWLDIWVWNSIYP